MNSKVTIRSLSGRKIHSNPKATPIVATTAYDYTLASIVDQAGVDLILVGDSASSIVQGATVPLGITLEEMIYHARCVTSANPKAFVVGDLPFMSYQVSPEDALRAAGRMVKEGRVEAIKLEGGLEYADHVNKISVAGIPVVGHIGLTPQQFHAMGGYRVQGKDTAKANKLLKDAKELADSGASLLVLEGVPAVLAKDITESVPIPTIGIGAGPHCDGQILVLHDLLGLTVSAHRPKFVKSYVNLKELACQALQAYREEVQAQIFPGEEHSYK